MRGFDPEFTDIIDYILRITERIWEDKQVQLCLDYYSDDCPVYTLAGLAVGAQEVTDNTLATQSAFPDRTLQADAVICGGDDAAGFHTSHLIYSEMTNLGPSDLGEPTGKKAAIFVIAHCIVRENRVVEEWLVRDNALLVEQLGLDVHEVARQKAAISVPQRDRVWRDSELARLNQPSSALGCDAHTAQQKRVMDTLTQLFGNQDGSDMPRHYEPDATVHAPAGRTLRGHDEIGQWHGALAGTFSNVQFSVDYLCEQRFRVHADDTIEGVHVAARWALSAEHAGEALFGAPCGARLLIIGETHCHIVDGRIRQEWTVFDELAVRTQIERARAT